MSPTSYRTALPRVIRPKRFAPTAKIIIARFAAPVNPCGENFPIHYKGRGRQRATVRAAPVVPPPTSQSRGTAPAKPSRQKNSLAVVPPARPHHKVAASRPPSAEKARARKTVQTKNQHRGRSPGPATSQSRGTAPAERRKSPRPQNRPDKKSVSRSFPRPRPHHKARHPRPQGAENARKTAPVQNRLTVASPSPPRFARKRRGHPAAAAPSFAGDQALILRMAIAVTCVGAALVPASALS